MKIQRTRNFTDVLELEDGDKTLSIEVEINFDRVCRSYREAEVALAHAQKCASETPTDPETLETYGVAIAAVFAVLFGEENTMRILQFYEDDYVSMLGDIWPYITGVLLPAMQQAREKKLQDMKAARKKRW